MLAAAGAGEGDPIVFVRGDDGILRACRITRDRVRWFHLEGQIAEHVTEHNGVWVYQLRRA